MVNPSKLRSFLFFGTVLMALITSSVVPASAMSPASGGRTLDPNTRFFIAKPVSGALQQVVKLLASHDLKDAALIGKMIVTPQAVWFTGGTPASVTKDVKSTVKLAAAQHAVPVLVIYNVPGRDCAQYSAGGAATGDDYKAWVDAFVAGLGTQKVVVIVEPDGLALLPTDCGQPDTYDRVSLISYAAHALLADPNASIYMDAGHSAWHNVADMSTRLVNAGVQDVNGFFLNLSNYQYSANEVQYGTWISDCIAFATVVSPGNYGCPDQYWNGGPLPAKIAVLNGEWNGVALSAYGVWSDDSDTIALNTSGINLRYANMLGATQPTVHFVIDTSRNGQGPWQPPADHPAGDPQDWCNPPARGLGLLPTANTGVALVDAYLWVKIPGASDGQCTRWTTGPLDPVRGVQDPAAGLWFPDMALELVQNANPALTLH